MLKKGFGNQNLYGELAEELMQLAEIDGGQSTCLDIIENLPIGVQVKIIENLAKKNNSRLIAFFQLLARETEGEIQKIALRALRKYQYLGYKIKPLIPKEINSQNVQAFVSPTRLTGACVLVFITELDEEYQAHYFSLFFNHLGIKEYFQYCSKNKADLLSVINKQGLVPIDFLSGLRLLEDAYGQNQRFKTKPASGFSQYKKFFLGRMDEAEDAQKLDKIEFKPLVLAQEELNPERVINAYFLALKNMDAALVYDLTASILQKKFGSRGEFITNWFNPFEKYIFIKSIPINWETGQDRAKGSYKLVASNENDELEKIDFRFELIKTNGCWRLLDVKVECLSPINNEDTLNPLNYQVHAAIFKIDNYHQIKCIFDNWPDIHLTGEFNEGYCYKWFKAGNLLDIGIDVAKDIYGEFILTNKELVIFGANLKNITEVCHHFHEQVQKENNNIGFFLRAKGFCKVRDVYQVITDPDFSLGSMLVAKSKMYYTKLIDFQHWYTFLKNKAIEHFVLDSKIQVFHLGEREDKFEVLLYKNHAFFFCYNDSLEILTDYLANIQEDIRKISSELEYWDEKEKWEYYKLISSLSKDPYTKVFVPHAAQWQVTKKMRIVN
ncbi:MAG: hypothetical protein ACOYJ1_01640 [Peptococcales bacterium]